MKELLLGIDIGTSACKVALFRKSGEVVAGSIRYTIQNLAMRSRIPTSGGRPSVRRQKSVYGRGT